jgi:hypothetical protein
MIHWTSVATSKSVSKIANVGCSYFCLGRLVAELQVDLGILAEPVIINDGFNGLGHGVNVQLFELDFGLAE